jgi:hemerythrin
MATTQPDLSTGHAEVDADHRALMALVKEAVAAIQRGDCEGSTDLVWQFEAALADHFALEDRLMAFASEAHSTAHREAHSRFLADVRNALVGLQASGITPALRLWAESRFASWFRYHIVSNDQALVQAALAGDQKARVG